MRDPRDPGTSELLANVKVERYGSAVPKALIQADGEFSWAAALARFNRLAEGAYARNSVRAHRSDWGVWSKFCLAQQVPVLPASADLIKAFLEDQIVNGGRKKKNKKGELVPTGAKRATLDRYLATLALAHRAADLENPLDTVHGKLVVRTVRKKLTKKQKAAHGLTWERVKAILAHLNPDRAIDVRDGALLCLGYDTFGRLSELVSYQWSDLSDVEFPDGSGRIHLERSKTDQEGEGKWHYVSADTLAWLKRWKAMAGLSEGAMFRSAPRSGNFERPLGERDMPRILKRLALRAGLKNAAAVSGHSLRVGKDQDAVAMGLSLAEIMQAGGWKSPVMPARYARELEVERGASAKIARAQQRSAPTFTTTPPPAEDK